MKAIFEQNQELNELFKNCPVEILKHWEVKEYPAGAIVYHQAEKCDSLSIIIEGCVSINVMAENGRKYSPRILEKGDFIGEMELFEEKPLLNSVEAITNLKLLQIKRDYFLRWLELDRNISLYIIKYSNNRSCYCAQKAMENSLYSLKMRVCNYLLYFSNQTNNRDNRVEIKINKEQLCERLAVTIRSINRILQYLKKENIIEVDADLIIIKDPKKIALEVEKSRSM
jgi:CRP-like cAMP-binding protein